jgi:CheY-like chemotaxis protein
LRTGTADLGNCRTMPQKPLAAEAAQALQCQTQRMAIVGHLTGGVVHDFNNLLTVIIGTIEVLEEAVADRPELSAIAGLIAEAAARGADLTSHLLAFARGQPSPPREVDVNALLTAAARLLRPTLGEQIEVDCRLASGVSSAWVDASQLMTAILSLAVVAREAMPDGGKLLLESKAAGVGPGISAANDSTADHVTIEVSVSAYGGSSDRRQLAFADLGMATDSATRADGNVRVCRAAGRETSVEIHLPRATNLIRSQAAPSGKVDMQGGTQAVLIVEDDVLVRRYVVSQVLSLGYRALDAGNASEAMEIIDASEEIHLLLTDVMMPGALDGRQLAVEALSRRPSLKVLYTSGYSENAMIDDGHPGVGELILAKPYRKVDLARMIRTALAG